MRAWISKEAIRLIADNELEADLLRALPNRVFKAMNYVCKSEGYLKGIAEIYLDEVKEIISLT